MRFRRECHAQYLCLLCPQSAAVIAHVNCAASPVNARQLHHAAQNPRRRHRRQRLKRRRLRSRHRSLLIPHASSIPFRHRMLRHRMSRHRMSRHRMFRHNPGAARSTSYSGIANAVTRYIAPANKHYHCRYGRKILLAGYVSAKHYPFSMRTRYIASLPAGILMKLLPVHPIKMLSL